MADEMIPIDRWLRHLQRNLKVARAGRDPEGVHQVRVATRRLDSWLRLGGWRVFRDDLRWLRLRASAVRDIDVMILRKGKPRGLKSVLMESKRVHQAEFSAACDNPRLAAMMIGLSVLPPLSIQGSQKRLAKMRDDVFDCGKVVEEGSIAIESLHRLRRALRRLRYGLELAGESTAPLRKLQEMLGTVNDLSVALRCIDQIPESEYPAQYRDELENELALMLPLARGFWIEEKEAIERTRHR